MGDGGGEGSVREDYGERKIDGLGGGVILFGWCGCYAEGEGITG